MSAPVQVFIGVVNTYTPPPPPGGLVFIMSGSYTPPTGSVVPFVLTGSYTPPDAG